MIFSVNVLGNPVSVFQFENGWSVLIEERKCGHHNVMVVPSRIYETLQANIEFMKDDNNEAKRMAKRGDWYEHITDATDEKILDIIVGVATRATEPGLAKVNQQIHEAVARTGKPH